MISYRECIIIDLLFLEKILEQAYHWNCSTYWATSHTTLHVTTIPWTFFNMCALPRLSKAKQVASNVWIDIRVVY